MSHSLPEPPSFVVITLDWTAVDAPARRGTLAALATALRTLADTLRAPWRRARWWTSSHRWRVGDTGAAARRTRLRAR